MGIGFCISELQGNIYSNAFFRLLSMDLNRPQPGDGSDPASNRSLSEDNPGLPENRQQNGRYVAAVNHHLKTEIDNSTIGLLICKGMDKVEAQYVLECYSQPLGISSYELSGLIPEEFKGSLPTIEEIEAELTDNDGEEQV